MCLVLLAWQQHPDYPLVVAANRDEYHQRPTAPLGLWSDAAVLAGRDLQAGGTWLGTDGRGRMAAVTNLRGQTSAALPSLRSRGELPAGFLTGPASARDYARATHARRDQYNGFNLLVADDSALWYAGHDSVRQLPPGIYGLANAGLDAPWPKVVGGTRALRAWLARSDTVEALLEILAERTVTPGLPLPETGLSAELERRLAPAFIDGELYGTRASSVLLRSPEGDVLFRERRFGPAGRMLGERQFRWLRGAAQPVQERLHNPGGPDR